jgi:hypothetical protein
LRLHTIVTDLDMTHNASLPEVDIAFCYRNADSRLIEVGSKDIICADACEGTPSEAAEWGAAHTRWPGVALLRSMHAGFGWSFAQSLECAPWR